MSYYELIYICTYMLIYVKCLEKFLAQGLQCGGTHVQVCTLCLCSLPSAWNASPLLCRNLGVQPWQSFQKGGLMGAGVRQTTALPGSLALAEHFILPRESLREGGSGS